jgi:hypothetical protein
MNPHRIFAAISTIFALVLTGCNGGGSSNLTTSQTPAGAPANSIVADNPTPGVTPYISFVKLHGTGLVLVKEINYTIAAKPGHVSKPVTTTYSFDYLVRRGYSPSPQTLTVPIFGLYADYRNTVNIKVVFQDNSSVALPIQITTGAPSGYAKAAYSKPKILKARTPGSSLGFDYFYIESLLGTPVVMDTDAEVRWVGPGTLDSQSSIFVDNGFVIGTQAAANIYRFELDGTAPSIMPLDYNDPAIKKPEFHHSIDQGKVGLLVDLSAYVNGLFEMETILAEIDNSGKVLSGWDFASILTQYMKSQGDDPTLFVRNSAPDWFHLNSAIYDPSDDSIIASSRENFVIKIDYTTGNVIWIFGDPTKYWYTFPSLRAKSVTLTNSNFYPIGQHSLSFTTDHQLLLFNNGLNTISPPPGAPAGELRSFSSVSTYSIDTANRTAQETWRFDYDKSPSNFCSSVFQTTDGSTLIDYAVVPTPLSSDLWRITDSRLVGLDSTRQVAFDFEIWNPSFCASWTAQPLPFEALSFK